LLVTAEADLKLIFCSSIFAGGNF